MTRLVDPEFDPSENSFDAALRPKTLDEFVGQNRVRDQLSLVLSAAKNRQSAADHVLLAGPPGLGKTTLAMIVAAQVGAPLRTTSGPAITHPGDLASILSSLIDGEVLFIDEIHRLPRPVEELLYLAMEDFRVDVMVGKGPGATSIPLDLARFTLIGATTRAGLLPAPLRDRFGFTAQLDYYPDEELAAIIARSAKALDIAISTSACSQIASRSRGTPRIANRLLRRARDFAQVHGSGEITLESAKAALDLYEVDELGLDRLDRAVLNALATKFAGGPTGLSTLAISVGEETSTLEAVCEPFLVRLGLISRTSRGRVLTALGYRAIGISPSSQENALF